MWTIGDIGDSNGPSSGDRLKPDGQMDFTPTWGEDGQWSGSMTGARQDVAYEHDFHKLADVPTAWGRVDVPDPAEGYGIPDPGCGHMGNQIDLASVGVEVDTPGIDLDGGSAGGDSMPSTLD